MAWNWQKPDWPHFTWERSRISAAEQQFLFTAGVAIGTLRHLPEDQHQQLLAEMVNRPEDDLLRSFSQPLSEDMLFAWHGAAEYRTSLTPMQLLSGPAGASTIHFQAPPAKRLPAEMKRFVAWFNRSAAQGTEPLPAITRAGIAYLFFHSILPFPQGNERIGRAIAQKALLQGFGQPVPVSLAAAMLAQPQSYYQAILGATRQNEITGWLVWFANMTLQAQLRTVMLVEFTIARVALLAGMRGQINERQQKSLDNMFRDGPEGLKQGLTAGHYSAITGASPATTTRDLVDLVHKGALIRTGERKHARYKLNLLGPD